MHKFIQELNNILLLVCYHYTNRMKGLSHNPLHDWCKSIYINRYLDINVGIIFFLDRRQDNKVAYLSIFFKDYYKSWQFLIKFNTKSHSAPAPFCVFTDQEVKYAFHNKSTRGIRRRINRLKSSVFIYRARLNKQEIIAFTLKNSG